MFKGFLVQSVLKLSPLFEGSFYCSYAWSSTVVAVCFSIPLYKQTDLLV